MKLTKFFGGVGTFFPSAVGGCKQTHPAPSGHPSQEGNVLVDLSECYQEFPSPGGVAAKQTGWVSSIKKFVFSANFYEVFQKGSDLPEARKWLN